MGKLVNPSSAVRPKNDLWRPPGTLGERLTDGVGHNATVILLDLIENDDGIHALEQFIERTDDGLVAPSRYEDRS